jgi:outer membrane protein TolC
MKKLYFILSAILCTTLFFTNIAAFADNMSNGLLTLDEAKKLALKTDVQYNLQDSYIQDAIEKYEELSEDGIKNSMGSGNIADKAASVISQKISLESAASNVRKAVLTKQDLKRASDYEVTNAFYTVIISQNSLAGAKLNLKLKKEELDLAEIKYEFEIITKDSFVKTVESYDSLEAAYNKALSELENSIMKLEKSIGINLDVHNNRLDTALVIPDINSINLEKVKEGNIKNNLSYFSAREQYKLAEYKLALTEEKYDDYYEDRKSKSSAVEEKFDNMLYDVQKEFDDVEYSYNKKLDDLEETINNQYESLKDAYASYEDLKNDFEDEKHNVELNKMKYQMKLITKAALDNSEASLKKLENQIFDSASNLIIQYFNITQYSLD